jgi:hypothetical protein
MLFDYIIEILSLMVVAGTIISVIVCWVKLPETVAVHYNVQMGKGGQKALIFRKIINSL